MEKPSAWDRRPSIVQPTRAGLLAVVVGRRVGGSSGFLGGVLGLLGSVGRVLGGVGGVVGIAHAAGVGGGVGRSLGGVGGGHVAGHRGIVGGLLGLGGGVGRFGGRVSGLLLVGARSQGQAHGNREQRLVDGHDRFFLVVGFRQRATARH